MGTEGIKTHTMNPDQLVFAVIERLNRDYLESDVSDDLMTDTIVLRVKQKLLKTDVHVEHRTIRIQEPGIINGLRALLPRLTPKMAQVRVSTTLSHVCPHIDIARNGELHFSWLYPRGPEGTPR